jgi:hypothetical protein
MAECKCVYGCCKSLSSYSGLQNIHLRVCVGESACMRAYMFVCVCVCVYVCMYVLFAVCTDVFHLVCTHPYEIHRVKIHAAHILCVHVPQQQKQIMIHTHTYFAN